MCWVIILKAPTTRDIGKNRLSKIKIDLPFSLSEIMCRFG